MKPTEIIAALETAKTLPVAALRAAVEQADAITPAVIAVVETAAEGAYLIPNQQRLVLRGIHVLAAARKTELWQPLLRLVRLPRGDLDIVLDETLTETLASIMIAVYDGDAPPLVAAITDPKIDGFVRWALFGVLARATYDGSMPRAAAHDVLDRFERDNLAEPGHAAWEGWQDAVRLLGFDDLAPRVRAAWADGRNPQAVPDQQDWDDELQSALARPDDGQRFVDDRLTPLDDPVAALEWTESERPAKAQYPGTDPAARIVLDQDEIGWLDGFLRRASDTAMRMEELDGFMTALVVGPEMVPPSEYLPEVWGGDGPVYDSQEQAQYVLDLMMRHWNTIARRLHDKSPHLPIMADAELTGRAWADAFMRGVAMRMDLWDSRLPHDEHLTTFLGHVLILAASSEVAAQEGVTPEQRAKMLGNLPLAVMGMHLYWRENPIAPFGAEQPPPARRAKVGRNDPCPCGSGKKFKKCCAGVTLH